jgi:FixJ family two-component response regulator
VSDVVMPNMSGIELSKRLREERASLPVLLMSGYPEPAGEGSPIGDDVDLVLKPFLPSELCDRVDRAIASGQRDDAES